MQDDHDLREGFGDLRRQDEAQAGEFHAFFNRSAAQRGVSLASRWVAVAALVVAVVWLQWRPGRHSGEPPSVSITEWKSSTDFLLQTPGQELLRTIPKIGEWPGGPPARGRNGISRDDKNKNVTKALSKEEIS